MEESAEQSSQRKRRKMGVSTMLVRETIRVQETTSGFPCLSWYRYIVPDGEKSLRSIPSPLGELCSMPTTALIAEGSMSDSDR